MKLFVPDRRLKSARLKYLFFCGSVVVAPVRGGGFRTQPGNEFEEFFFHRLVDGDNALRPESVQDLPELVASLQDSSSSSSTASSNSGNSGDGGDDRARSIAERGGAWAAKELTKRAAWWVKW